MRKPIAFVTVVFGLMVIGGAPNSSARGATITMLVLCPLFASYRTNMPSTVGI